MRLQRCLLVPVVVGQDKHLQLVEQRRVGGEALQRAEYAFGLLIEVRDNNRDRRATVVQLQVFVEQGVLGCVGLR
ncbi:hypothetical protein PSA5_19420 [Pseudomonas syringae pv. actinidiae]|nr:hypothetical protein PSA5_19420 [Pseudomonas syringae pv. actinidiae]